MLAHLQQRPFALGFFQSRPTLELEAAPPNWYGSTTLSLRRAGHKNVVSNSLFVLSGTLGVRLGLRGIKNESKGVPLERTRLGAPG